MTVDSAKRLLAAATIFAGAFVAALALATPASRNFAFVSGGDRLDVFTESGALAATLGAIVAVIAAASVARVRGAVSIAVFGCALLMFAALVTSPVQLHLRAIAAGLILGGTAALIATNRLLQCSLVAGAVSALVMAGPIVKTPVRYRDYAADEPQIYLLIGLAMFAVLLAVSAFVFVAPKPVESRRRVLSVGCLVPIAGLVLCWLFVRTVGSFGSHAAMQNRWLLGLAVIPLLVGAAFALPASTGALVLTALAFLSAGTMSSFGLESAAAFVASLLVGISIGWRRPMPLVGFAVLAVVASTGAFTDPPLEVISSVANVLVLPFAVGVLYASLLPTTAAAVTIGVTTPLAVAVPIVAEFGWTAYTPLTSVEPSFSSNTWVWTSTAVSVLSVAAAGAAYVVLTRRRGM